MLFLRLIFPVPFFPLFAVDAEVDADVDVDVDVDRVYADSIAVA